MASNIDSTKPTTGTATTQSVRDNFAFAKSEIEALQDGIAAEVTDRAAAVSAEAATRAAADADEANTRAASINAEATTRAAADAAEATARDAAIAAAKAAMWPVGSIYISTTATNPNTLLGFGTWSAFGAGRVLVSQDTGQAEFDTLGETGGAKTHTLSTAEMPAHTHTQNAHTHTQDAHTHTQNAHNHSTLKAEVSGGAYSPPGAGTGTGALTTGSTTATNQNTTATNQNTTATNQNTGGGGAHNNLQPYIIVCMWQRTA